MGMTDIVEFECVGVEDVFFDSVDLLSDEDCAVDGFLKYEFGRNELRSVKERRDSFLREMGFVESSPVSGSDDAGLVELGLERMVETRDSVSSSCSSSSIDCEEENSGFSVRECSGDGNLVVDEEEDDQPIRHRKCVCEDNDTEPSTSSSHKDVKRGKSLNKKIGHWWKEMVSKRNGMSKKCKCSVGNGEFKKFEMSRTKVHVNKKRVKELSALFEAQEIRAHEGVIWCMKFSPDGQYLATGGQDGVVRVWRVKSVDSCCDRFIDESTTRRDKKLEVPVVVVPDKMFQIEEQPVQEFYGHAGDVLDLAWSQSNYIISSSTDKTVRLWHVGSESCLGTFLHTDYVTCVQFNPTDDSYFISGSIDGKVRVWGVSNRRVLDWADVRDAVTALCYQPDGQGFVVGSLSGNCRFYETKGNLVELSAHILIHSSKRSSTSRITGLQFYPEDSQRVMVMTEDSKLRILDKDGVVSKYRALPESGGQMAASFTSNGRHIVSVGEDSSVYVWNHDEPFLTSPRHKKSNRSCEHFSSEGVSVAISWSGTVTEGIVPATWSSSEHETPSKNQEPLSFSLSNLFSSKSSAIWPEDMPPIFSLPQPESKIPALSSAWGLVILTANCDGMIRTFHNYGLPVKV